MRAGQSWPSWDTDRAGTGCTSLVNSITSCRLWMRSSRVSSAVSSPRDGSTGKFVCLSSNCQGRGL